MVDVKTEDIVLLETLNGKTDDLQAQVNVLGQRLKRIEAAQPGGKWGVLTERAIMVILAILLARLNIDPSPIVKTIARESGLVSTSTHSRGN